MEKILISQNKHWENRYENLYCGYAVVVTLSCWLT